MSTAFHLVISAPTGYNTRELLSPLRELLTQDTTVDKVTVITPGATAAAQLFPDYGEKFSFIAAPDTEGELTALIKTLKPQLVVTPTAGLDDRDVPLLVTAKKIRVPTFTYIASWDNVFKMERFKRLGEPYVLADYFGVWNRMMRDHLLRVFPELDATKIFIVGVPRLDIFADDERIPTKEQLYAYLSLPNMDWPLIHIATTELYPMEYVVREIVSAQHRGLVPRNVYLYASVHPGGDMQKHRDYAQRYGITIRYSFGRHEVPGIPSFIYNPTSAEGYMLTALFKHAHLLVNHSSTVAIESMLADVPVINIRYGRRFDWWRWRRSMVWRDFQQHYADIIRSGGTSVARNPREFISFIQHYLAHPEYKRAQRRLAITQMITFTDGSASRRLLDRIKQAGVR